MTKNFTEVELLEIISCANELITALEGTNEDLHRDNSTKMCETWDHLNDDLAPPSVVKAMAKEILRLKAREIELEKHATKGWDWAGELADARTEQEVRAELAESKLEEVNDLLSGCDIARRRLTEALEDVKLDRPKTCDACIDVLSLLGFHYKTAKLKDVRDEVKRLKGLDKQEPYGFVHNICDLPDYGSPGTIFKKEDRHYGRPVYLRPVPVINLVDLVPEARPDLEDNCADAVWRGMCDGWNACRYAILRNIEGVK